jgi:transposase
MYALPEWLATYVTESFDLEDGQLYLLNDDRFGRELDRLFDVDHAPTLTQLILGMIKEFNVELDRFHNDSTSVTFSGSYQNQKDPNRNDRPPWITLGFNKDHRPDLKQLVWNMTVSADGAVPIHVRLHDGNTTDDTTHIDSFDVLSKLVGHTGFVYVADSKLSTAENMRHIDQKHGTFLTVMPKTRKEDRWFEQYARQNELDWQEVRRDRNHRGRNKPDIVYHAVESPQLSAEGFRIFWYRSSQKLENDQVKRFRGIAKARKKIELLAQRKGRGRLRSEKAAREAVDRILESEGVARFFRIHITTVSRERYKQRQTGRPGKDTCYKRTYQQFIDIEIEEDAEAIRDAAKDDGLFPLITNSKDMTPKEALDHYKYQPFLEKRFEQLKSVFDMAPIWLKKPERIASLLFLYFIAMLIESLIEREIRRVMKAQGVESMALYPEGRHCNAPTVELVIESLRGFRRHRLLDAEGNLLKVYYDELKPEVRKVLELLNVDLTQYGIGK